MFIVSFINAKHLLIFTECVMKKIKHFINKMRFEKKITSRWGNSVVAVTKEFELNEEVYLIDKEMLEFIRGIRIENGKQR